MRILTPYIQNNRQFIGMNIDTEAPTGSLALIEIPQRVVRKSCNSAAREGAQASPSAPAHASSKSTPPRVAHDQDPRAKMEEVRYCWTQSATLSQRSDFSLIAAQRLRPGDFGILDEVASNSSRLERCLENVSKYYPLLATGGAFRIDRYYGNLRIVHEGNHLPLLAEFAFLSLVSRIRSLVGYNVKPHRVAFVHLPSNPDACASWLGCKVERGPSYSIIFHNADLSAAIPGSNPNALAPLHKQAGQKLEQLNLAPSVDPKQTLAPQIRRLLLWGVGQQPVDLAWASERLGMSARTLQRRLRQEGTSFREVMTYAQLQQFRRLSSLQGVKKSDLWKHLGFSDLRTFRRAKSKWSR